MQRPDVAGRVLLVHAEYRQRGGEEAVVRAEVALLRSRGHDVEELRFDNTSWSVGSGVADHLRRAVEAVWSPSALARARRTIRGFQPDVVHVHNTFPSASPSIYSAVPDGTAVVQTLHNYRLMCPIATFYRDGRPCTDCLGRRVPMPGVIHACYGQSTLASAVVAAMLTTHNLRGTWDREIDRYIALTGFARDMFVAGGLPEDRISVKPNFLDRPAAEPDHLEPRTGGFLFVGRLAPEKGVRTLLATAGTTRRDITIIGDGPLQVEVDAAAALGSVRALGRQTSSEIGAEMRKALALVFPSEWFEGFPITLLEAFSAGLPVIASAIGGIPEIVTDGKTGLLFPPGDARALSEKMKWAEMHPVEMQRMADNARTMVKELYGPIRNYELLIDIYRAATARATAA